MTCVEGILAIFQLSQTAHRNKILFYREEEAWQSEGNHENLFFGASKRRHLISKEKIYMYLDTAKNPITLL